MLVCVDTNVMLSAFARNSPLVPLFDAIAAGRLPIAVSTSILYEYEEIGQQTGVGIGPSHQGVGGDSRLQGLGLLRREEIVEELPKLLSSFFRALHGVSSRGDLAAPFGGGFNVFLPGLFATW